MTTKKGTAIGKRWWALVPLVLCALFLAQPEARADHSRKQSCITCHSLRSGSVVPGSRNVLTDMVLDILYNDDFYCGSPWYDVGPPVASTAATVPLDCGFCHDGDIGSEIKAATGGKLNTGSDSGSAHPVGVGADNFTFAVEVRIFCNDCHNGGSPHNLTPDTLCSKSDTDGYPNHNNAVTTGPIPGTNDHASNPPSLSAPYGTSSDPAGIKVDWSRSTKAVFENGDMLCFICHDNDDSSGSRPPYAYAKGFREASMTSGRGGGPMEDIMDSYNASHGGHNVQGIGQDGKAGGVTAQRLPCYECHDPHAAADPEGGVLYNDALISNAGHLDKKIVNPYDPTDSDNDPVTTDSFTFDRYDRGAAKEKELCMECHQSGADQVELEIDKKAVVFESPIISSDNLAFAFHENAHEGVIAGCLQGNGGCHYSPHNNSPYECLECHTESARGNNDKLNAVAHVDSEFDFIGNVTGNGIVSQHDIPYRDTGVFDPTLDMSDPADNGCLSCHNVLSTLSFTNDVLVTDNDTPKFDQPPATTKAKLVDYDEFCNSCHDKSNESNEDFPKLANKAQSWLPPWVSEYFISGGHGNTAGFESGNTKSTIPCLECHQYHGSTAYKLLPGDKQTTDYVDDTIDSGGRVVKGFDYGTTTNGANWEFGGVADTTELDYTDYTTEDGKDSDTDGKGVNRASVKFANYLDYSNPSATYDNWNTYYEKADNGTTPGTDSPDVPDGTAIHFGTSGDRVQTGSAFECTDVAADANSTDKKIGFCDACHLYDHTTDGTSTTFNKSMTHASFTAGVNCDGPNSAAAQDMQKDCTECHDPHGSGDITGGNTNWYMIKGKITTDTDTGVTYDIKTYNVVLDDVDEDGELLGADSYDESDTDNYDDICAVCHTDTSHNSRTTADANDHNVGTDCIRCHGHEQLFMPGGCSGCHGFPPTSVDENYTGGGGPHEIHVNFLAEKLDIPLPLTANENPKELCGPCHGDGAGSDSTHLEANVKPAPDENYGSGTWGTGGEARKYVTLKVRNQATATGIFSTTTSWDTGALYDEMALPLSGSGTADKISDLAMDMDNSRCGNLLCHGMLNSEDRLLPPYNREALESNKLVPVSWFTPSRSAGQLDTAGDYNDGLIESEICQGCHDSTPADLRVFTTVGTLVYGKRGSGAKQRDDDQVDREYFKPSVDAAGNYYGPVSGYGRGGHGDERLSEVGTLDYNSSSLSTPVDCSFCHDPTMEHFITVGVDSIPTSDSNRLRNTTIEYYDGSPTVLTSRNAGLCNTPTCHAAANYPGFPDDLKHHPSYVDYVWTGNPINSHVDTNTTWIKDVGNTYNQSDYGAANTITTTDSQHEFPGNIDRFNDWYDRGASWAPSDGQSNFQSPANHAVFLGENESSVDPRAVLPLKQYLLKDSGNSDDDYVLCVTCHNPHGTDLYVHDEEGVGEDIADHQMLRLQHEDSTLCNACH